MTVENNPNKTIQSLDENLPLDTDKISECDNHLRLIKSVLVTNFPVFNQVITYTSKQLNDLSNFMGQTTDKLIILNTSVFRPLPDKQTRNLSINLEGVLSSSLPLIPIGSFYYSYVPPSKIDLLYPGVFTVPDGKLVPNSKYKTITGNDRVPDLFVYEKPCFLRPKTDANALNSTARFTTAINGLNLINSGATLIHDHGGAPHNHNYNDNRSSDSTQTGEGREYRNLTIVQKTTGPENRVDTSRPIISEYRHGHAITINDGGRETAPKHLILYPYFRIN